MDVYHHVRDIRPNSGPGLQGFIASPDRPRAMLRECPRYHPTPLDEKNELATGLDLGALWLKDESTRMGLGSFKALGGAFAVAQILQDAVAKTPGSKAGAGAMTGPDMRALASGFTFITASAGNHGLSVAAGARVFGAGAVIVLSETVPDGFAARLEKLDAKVIRVPGTYEDSVTHAIAEAQANNWQLLADGSWPGYTGPPAIVMEGYTVLAEECRNTFTRHDQWPTHVFLQAGVGGLAAAVAANIRTCWDKQPKIIVVEPEYAPCLLTSIRAGKLTNAPGPVSSMGRLDCKDASLLAFDSLRRDADCFVTISEDEARAAVDWLANKGMHTTPSGAAGVAALLAGEELGLDATSSCLAIISEGPETTI